MILFLRPYHLLLIAAILISFCSIYFWDQKINIPSNNVLIEYPAVFPFWVFSAFLIFLWVLYHITFSSLYNLSLTWLHVFVTLVCGVFLIIINKFEDRSLSELSGFDVLVDSAEYAAAYHRKISVVLYFGAAAQMIYVINLLKGANSKLKTREL